LSKSNIAEPPSQEQRARASLLNAFSPGPALKAHGGGGGAVFEAYQKSLPAHSH